MLTETEDSDRFKKDFKVFQFWIPVLEQAAILLLSEWLHKKLVWAYYLFTSVVGGILVSYSFLAILCGGINLVMGIWQTYWNAWTDVSILWFEDNWDDKR